MVANVNTRFQLFTDTRLVTKLKLIKLAIIALYKSTVKMGWSLHYQLVKLHEKYCSSAKIRGRAPR